MSPRWPRLLRSVLFALVVTGGLPWHSGAEAADPPRLRPLVGSLDTELVSPGDTLLDIAYRHRLGYEALTRLNPGVDPWVPEVGSVVTLPTRFILPDVREEGLAINVPEMRLLDFSTGGPPGVFAIAVGDAEDPTILGEFRIGRKRVDPVWNVPESIRAERPELPAKLPPGPENPLGGRWMTIGKTSYGIHGTHLRWSIGRETTHGCVRLYEDEVERLFDRIPEGTPIQIVYQPYKWGQEGDRLYFEAHPDLYGRMPDRLASALAVPRALGLLESLDLALVWQAIDEQRGAPVAVGRLPAERGED